MTCQMLLHHPFLHVRRSQAHKSSVTTMQKPAMIPTTTTTVYPRSRLKRNNVRRKVRKPRCVATPVILHVLSEHSASSGTDSTHDALQQRSHQVAAEDHQDLMKVRECRTSRMYFFSFHIFDRSIVKHR
jgi:hypothetical protein